MTIYREADTMKRKAFLRLRERYKRRGKTFVYVDESGFTPYAFRRRGYAPKGQRVYGLAPGRTRPNTSLIAANIDGKFEEPFLFPGACNAEIFNDWLMRQLCPRLTPNHVVVFDNVPFHKGERTRRIINDTGAILLPLPPYSPDLNPIEQDFGSIKKIREYNHQKSIDCIIADYQ
jgi:transposase